MTTEIEKRIEQLNPDTVDWNDPRTYAALGVGTPEPDEVIAEGAQPMGDTIAKDDAEAAGTPAADAAPAAVEQGATPGATDAKPDDPKAQPAGVATRDGKHVIPYAVLEQTRAALRQREAELTRLQEQLASAQAGAGQTGNATVDKAMTDPSSVSESDLEELETDFPAIGRALRAMLKRVESVAAPAAAPQAPAAPAASQPPETNSDEEFDLAIAQTPLLASWMANPQSKEWQRAKSIDAMLLNDSDYQAKSYAERFAAVQRMVAAEFGIKEPAAQAPAPAPRAAALPDPRPAAPPTLTDLGGSPPRNDADLWSQSPTTDLLARAEQMSEEQLMKLAGISY